METVVMIVETREEIAKDVAELVKQAIKDCRIYFAKDASEAVFKLQNVVPSVLVTDLELSRNYPGKKLIETVLQNKRLSALSIIVTSAPPDKEFCVDQVASCQLQFLPRPIDLETFREALHKALLRNVSSSQSTEFIQRDLKAGETLFKEGDKAELAFLLKSGKLRATKIENGKAKVLGEIMPGEFVGEMAYINAEPRSANVEAVLPSELIEIPIHSLDAIIFSKPTWSKALLKTLSKRLKNANNKKAA